MSERKFSVCLNSEPKAFNCSIGSLALGGICLVLAGIGKGLMWGLGASAVGFLLGGMISKAWHLGNIQRRFFWYLPWQKLWIDKNIIESHHRRLM